MITPKRRNNSYSVSHSRWTAYAIAGTASAIASAPCAEADIHYSGIINRHLEGSTFESAMLPLDVDFSITFLHRSGFAAVEINQGATSAGGAFVAGPNFYTSLRVDNLPRGVKLSTQSLRESCRGSASSTFTCRGFAVIGEATSTSGHFQQPGVGAIGFEFNRGAGPQLGWARIRTSGAPDYNLIVVDYAWGDPNQKIKTGQKTAHPASAQSKPDVGSLGLLALGAPGLLAWREGRKKSAATKS